MSYLCMYTSKFENVNNYVPKGVVMHVYLHVMYSTSAFHPNILARGGAKWCMK